MTIETLLNQPLTVVHRTPAAAADRYGNHNETVTASEDGVVGYLEQTEAAEVLVGGETYTSTWRAFLPAGTTIGPADRIVVAGVTYEVLGPPAHAYNPRTRRVSHIECKLRVTTG